jgi:hypothetical protein
MAFAVPTVHHWRAGDEMNADRMEEIKDAIDFLRNPPTARVMRLVSSQNLPAGARTAITFDTLYNSYDPYGMWSAGTPDRLTCQVPGWYAVEGVLNLDNAAAVESRLQLELWKNNTDFILRWDQEALPATGGNINIRKESFMFLNYGDYVQLKCWNGTGTRTAFNNGFNESPQMRARWFSN